MNQDSIKPYTINIILLTYKHENLKYSMTSLNRMIIPKGVRVNLIIHNDNPSVYIHELPIRKEINTYIMNASTNRGILMSRVHSVEVISRLGLSGNISFLDDDDMIVPNFLELIANEIHTNSILYCNTKNVMDINQMESLVDTFELPNTPNKKSWWMRSNLFNLKLLIRMSELVLKHPEHLVTAFGTTKINGGDDDILIKLMKLIINTESFKKPKNSTNVTQIINCTDQSKLKVPGVDDVRYGDMPLDVFQSKVDHYLSLMDAEILRDQPS